MDGLSGAASVIAVVDISAKVASLCLQYSVEVKHAKRDIERLYRKVNDTKNVLEKLQQLLEKQDESQLSTTCTLLNSLQRCFQELTELEATLQAKLELSRSRKAMQRFDLRALKWPLTSKEVEKTVQNLENYGSTFSHALQVDQTALSLRVDRKTDRLLLPTAEGASFDLSLGWCPHQVRRLQQLHTPDALRYLSTLDRRGYRPNNHYSCVDEPRCVANNVDLYNYNTAHTSTCSGSCLSISVDYDAVVDIIRAGGVPIVGIHVDAASSIEKPLLHLQVKPRTTSTRYTVISHVWFDGLGNPSANVLPTCQLQRLYTQLLSLPCDYESGAVNIGSLQVDWSRQSFVRNPKCQSPLFWMDTLCIPVGDLHRDLRMKAINQMASIYAAAVQELVLDAEMLQCEVGTGPALETLARVTCSAWMTRSWTLQEGVLARECVFQFKDCAIDPIHEWCLHGVRPGKPSQRPVDRFPEPEHEEDWTVYKELFNTLWDTLHQDWKSSYRRDPPTPTAYRASGGALFSPGGFLGVQAAGKVHTLPAAQGLSKRGKSGLDKKDHFTMDLTEEHRLKQLVDTWNELAHRSTTMPDDLHVIIANLLDFNADRIMEIQTREERMRAMILSFELLPVSLFWNTGPKWGDDVSLAVGDNNRWIPVEPSKSELSLKPVMRVTNQWLELDLVSDGTRNVQSVRAFILEENPEFSGRTSFLCVGLKEMPLVYDVSLLDSRYREVPAGYLGMPGGGHYIIVEALSESPSSPPTKGALFRRIPFESPDQKGVLQLTYCCPIALQPKKAGFHRKHICAYAEALPASCRIAIRFDPIPRFAPHPRRLNRGPSLQGSVTIIVLLPLPVTIGVGCMIAFIIVMARAPHAFTPTAQGLLAAFLVFYVGFAVLGIAWALFVIPYTYRMWLASFDSDWVEAEKKGWWGQYVRMERWLGSLEHAAHTRIKNGVQALKRAFSRKSGNEVRELGS